MNSIKSYVLVCVLLLVATVTIKKVDASCVFMTCPEYLLGASCESIRASCGSLVCSIFADGFRCVPPAVDSIVHDETNTDIRGSDDKKIRK